MPDHLTLQNSTFFQKGLISFLSAGGGVSKVGKIDIALSEQAEFCAI